MALLADADRAAVWAEYMRDISAERGAFGALTKADLRAAVNALDQWLDDNAAAVNSVIPQPARGALTSAQKSRLFRDVLRKRYEKGV